MEDNLERVDPQQIDIFKEIGNIGAGNAVTALAKMLNREIDMSVPDVQIVPFENIINIFNGPESLVIGIMVQMAGDLNGYLLMLMDPRDAYQMSTLMLEDSPPPPPPEYTLDTFKEINVSALTEMANILVGSYLSAICSLTGLSVIPSVPELAMDMVGAIISIVAIEYSQIGDSVLFLKTNFSDASKQINGHFFLIPDFESYKILMKSLGIE